MWPALLLLSHEKAFRIVIYLISGSVLPAAWHYVCSCITILYLNSQHSHPLRFSFQCQIRSGMCGTDGVLASGTCTHLSQKGGRSSHTCSFASSASPYSFLRLCRGLCLLLLPTTSSLLHCIYRPCFLSAPFTPFCIFCMWVPFSSLPTFYFFPFHSIIPNFFIQAHCLCPRLQTATV